MDLTADQIGWLQRNRAMSGGPSAITAASVPPTSTPQASTAAASPPDGASVASAQSNPPPVMNRPDTIAKCEKYLRDHNFHAERYGDEAPLDALFEVYLDNRSVKQEDVVAAVERQFPELKAVESDLAAYVREAWDLAAKDALKLPADTDKPRASDGGQFASPGKSDGKAAPVTEDYIRAYLKYFGFGPAQDGSDSSGGNCTFNGKPEPILDIIHGLEKQAVKDHYQPDPDQEAQVVYAVYDERLKEDRLARKAADQAWVRACLKAHGLAPNTLSNTGKNAQFDNKTLSVDDIADIVVKESGQGRPPIDHGTVEDVIAGIVKSSAFTSMLADASKSKTRLSGAISLAFSGGMLHKDLQTGKHSKDDATGQVSGQVTLEIHPENGMGVELSWVAQATGFKGDDSGSKDWNYSALTGPQAAWVLPFFKGLLKLEPLVQVLVGAGTATQIKTGKLALVQEVQGAAGGQILFTCANGKLSFGGQATWGRTAAKGADTTMDWGAQGFVQWNFQ
jgi:hypothetical protein